MGYNYEAYFSIKLTCNQFNQKNETHTHTHKTTTTQPPHQGLVFNYLEEKSI